MPDTSLLILGAGTFAIETLEIAELAGGFTPAGFVLSHTPVSTSHAGLPVFEESGIPDSLRTALIVGGIVSTRRRGFIERLARRGYSFATLRHPSAVISPRAVVAAGAVVGAGVIVASNTQVGPHVLLNRGANIGHDNQLGPFVTISPGATLAGAIDVGAGAYIGVGAVIRDHVTIGEGAVVAAGAVVVKPVEPHVLVAGCPATVVRRDVDGL
jgi:sugar O-acyltransferase (sialic acid O-acetyltransferase NeuD family)